MEKVFEPGQRRRRCSARVGTLRLRGEAAEPLSRAHRWGDIGFLVLLMGVLAAAATVADDWALRASLVIFFLALAVLRKYAWGPLLDSLQAREDFIRESLDSAKKDRDEAEVRLREYDDKLTEARAEATAIVEEGRRDAEVLRQRIEEEARAEAEKMVQRAKREIGIAKETAVKELYTLSGTLATTIASRIVARELTAEDHERLIDDSIAELGRQGPN